MGIENARQYAEMLVKQVVAKLDLFGAKADLLREAAEFSLQRRN
jgi:geranylgeranyl pyrophosphate synthase